ncbi:MAG: hypothetical protein A2309_00605 [Bacteroidetes bacterium RIFOXYB2_FULL_35_7]|nr:MAG: hypothetical protein A2X01_17005 [Bacteroidetes bacterium GWF2_35_48]OFY97045.1 MAG: hypothetical protein A2309_00605 [Bacteroidetes bacterium RIFOXYB2_FULL_35_7]HBX53362.1 hypothetical protein [Bacteroidales bacterium]
MFKLEVDSQKLEVGSQRVGSRQSKSQQSEKSAVGSQKKSAVSSQRVGSRQSKSRQSAVGIQADCRL